MIQKNIYLIGFMATGKSKIGSILSEMLHWPFADTDDMIVALAGKPIPQIFADAGEAGFRRLEKDIIKKITQYQRWVISLGGGAVMDKENWKIISESGITICLSATPEVLYNRISQDSNRPLMANVTAGDLRHRIDTMLARRMPHYRQAMVTFESRDEVSPEELARQIFQFLQDTYEKNNG